MPEIVKNPASNNNPTVVNNTAIVDSLSNATLIAPTTPISPVDKFDTAGNLVDDAGVVLKTKEVIDAEILAANQPKFDTLGNQVDDKGVIIKTKEVIDAETKAAEIKLDKDGNQIDDTGKIIKTKEELAKEVILNDDNLLVYEIVSKLSGFTPVDDKGQPIVYGESYEELAKRDADIVAQYGAQIAQNNEIAFYNTFPIAHEVNELIVKNNVQTIDDLVTLLASFSGDGTKLDIEKATEPQMIEKIVQARMAKGDSKEEAERFAAYSKADNKLKDDAKLADDFILTVRQNRITAQEEERLDKQAVIQKDIDDYWNNVATVINNGKLFEYTLPENIKVRDKLYSRQDFFDYLMKPVKDGYSQDMIEEANESVESKLLRSYLRFTKNDASQLIKIKVEDATVNALKNKLSKHNGIGNNPIQTTPTIINNDTLITTM